MEKGTIMGFEANGKEYCLSTANSATDKVYYQIDRVANKWTTNKYAITPNNTRPLDFAYLTYPNNADGCHQIIINKGTVLADKSVQKSEVLDILTYQGCSQESGWVSNADGSRTKSIRIDENKFELTDKDGNITVKGTWKIFAQCPTCQTVAEAALQAALTKARAKNGGKLTEATKVVEKVDKTYGTAGVVSYSDMKLGDILKNLSKTYNSLVEKAKVPEEAWQPGKAFFVRDGTGVISGAIDQGLEELRDIPDMIGMGLSLVSDPSGAYDQLSAFAQQMDWQKAKTMAREVVRGAVFADEFEKGGIYALHGTGRAGVVVAKAGLTGGGTLLLVRKMGVDLLAALSKLRQEVQDVLKNFSPETLTKFAAELGDQKFLDWINDPVNEKFVRGFVNHKLTELDIQDIGGLLAELENLDDLPPQVKKWLENSQSSERFKYYRDLGGVFEKAMKTALADINSPAYKGLLAKITDLDSRTILSQAQFCINGKSTCNNAGEYFVADFVAVIEKVDGAGEKYLDAVIIDTKLSQGTSFTPNQNVANGLGSMAIKSPSFTKIKGVDIDPTLLKKEGSITKQGSIRKMWSDGQGNYQNVE